MPLQYVHAYISCLMVCKQRLLKTRYGKMRAPGRSRSLMVFLFLCVFCFLHERRRGDPAACLARGCLILCVGCQSFIQDTAAQDARSEVAAMLHPACSQGHPNIVELIGVIVDADSQPLKLLLEQADLGDLYRSGVQLESASASRPLS
jgi:hypothetical protein